MQTGNGIEINGEKKEYDLTSINNGPNVSSNPDNTTVATEDVNNNVAETQQPVVEQTTPEVSSNETSTPVEIASSNTTTDQVEQASASVNPEPTPTVQENNNSQAEISAAVNNTVETVSKGVNDATNYVKSNKKLFIILGIAAVLIILFIIVVIFISSLIKKNEIVGVYACNRSTEGYRNNLGYYSDKFVINNNGTMVWGDFDDTDKENVSGTYTTKKKKYGTKTGYYTEFKLNKSVEKGVASSYSGTITINIFKMKNEGSYDFILSSGKSYMCKKIDGKKIKTPTTTTESTTTSAKVNNYTEAQKAPFIGDLDELSTTDDNQVYGKVQIKQGSLKPGDAIQVIGAGQTIDTKVVKIVHLDKGTKLDVALFDDKATGLSVLIYFDNVNRDEFKRGMTVIAANAYKMTKKYNSLFALGCESNADYSNFSSNDVLTFQFNNAKTTGRIIIPEGKTPADLCKSSEVVIEIDEDYFLTRATTAIVYNADNVYMGIATIQNAIEE